MQWVGSIRLCAILRFAVFAVLACVSPLSALAETRQEMEAQVASLRSAAQGTPQDATAFFLLGRALHDLANQYEEPLGRDAVDALDKSYRLKSSPLTKAYLGSAWTLVARDSKKTIEKIDCVAKGTGLIDEAVGEAPTDLIVRRVRYENSFALPDIFERKKIVEQDLDYLLKLYLKQPSAFDSAYDPANVLLMKARLLLYENNWPNAKKYAELGLKIVKDPETKNSIQDFLAGKEVKK